MKSRLLSPSKEKQIAKIHQKKGLTAARKKVEELTGRTVSTAYIYKVRNRSGV